MVRRSSDSGAGGVSPRTVLLMLFLASCSLLYTGFSLVRRRASAAEPAAVVERQEEMRGACCRGIKNRELWGPAVKWGTDFRFNSSRQCCGACRELCSGEDGPCLCDTWVFCGDRDLCGDRFGQCWLKKQKDVLAPELHGSGEHIPWTSGLIFGKGEGIIVLETYFGSLHLKLFPECAPHSVEYILELLGSRYCAGCQFYRAERRGQSWDAKGNHIDDASFGPPYGLVQGSFGAEGVQFKDIPKEYCPSITRGSVAWVGSGPDFFISLADHHEWGTKHTVFASVFLPEDMALVEKMSTLPTYSDVWSGINVSLLEKPISLKVKRITGSYGSLGLGS